MNMDPTRMKDWQIAEQAESAMRPIDAVGRDFGLDAGDIIPAQRGIAKIDGRLVVLLDLTRVLSERDQARVDAVSSA